MKARIRQLFSRGHPKVQREARFPAPGKAHMPAGHSGVCSNKTLLYLQSQWCISISLVFSLSYLEIKETHNIMQATKQLLLVILV